MLSGLIYSKTILAKFVEKEEDKTIMIINNKIESESKEISNLNYRLQQIESGKQNKNK
jgi:hypothetical protein